MSLISPKSVFFYTIFLSFTTCIFSCKIYQPSYTFQGIERDTTLPVENAVSVKDSWKIKNTDQLIIHVSSLNPEEDKIFNISESAFGEKSQNYMVSKEGTIYFHKIGSIPVVGLKLADVKFKLEEALKPFLKDPIVSVRFSNHYVTIMGEVGLPKKINLNNDLVTLLDILAESGKSSADVNMNNLLLIRETSGSRQFKNLNLEDPSIFNSEYYHMQPGDIVVVKPNIVKMMNEAKRLRTQQVTTLSLQLVTIGLVVYQTFFRN
jgi:polysaccharide export outer membrane protein